MSAELAIQDDPSMAPDALRRVMGRFATGVTIVTTVADGKREGVTANSFSTVSLDPPMVLWSLSRNARSFSTFIRAGHFAVNVLGVEQINLSRHFSTPHPDKFADVPMRRGLAGCPLIVGAIAVFECETHTVTDGGDHAIFIGRVRRATQAAGDPLIYHDRAYHGSRRLS